MDLTEQGRGRAGGAGRRPVCLQDARGWAPSSGNLDDAGQQAMADYGHFAGTLRSSSWMTYWISQRPPSNWGKPGVERFEGR